MFKTITMRLAVTAVAALLVSNGHVLAIEQVVATNPPSVRSYLYPMDFAPHSESKEDILAREKMFEDAWKSYFTNINAMIKSPDTRNLARFIKSTRADTLYMLGTEYGLAQLKEPAIAKLKVDFAKNIALAATVLSRQQRITDIGDVANLRSALHAAVELKKAGLFTADMSGQVEALLSKYVEGKCVFWGFTRKFPYFLSGYNKEVITMDVASDTKLLYQDTGKFPNTIDSFDAAWAQLTLNAYETDNSPHYDSSVNLLIVLNWAVKHGRLDDLKQAPHFRMFFKRMAATVMANGESANYGKSMSYMRKYQERGVAVDDFRISGSMGIGWCLRWAYKFYGDPDFLYLARKYEMMNASGKAPVTLMPKALDLNFFDVRGVTLRKDTPLSLTTLRLKGPGWSLDRGVRRENIQPVQDKLILSTGSHPRSPSMVMDMSFTQSKVKDQRRMGIDNLIFNGTHTVTIVGRPDAAEETNRIFLTPDDITYPGTGEFAGKKSACLDKQTYTISDYYATRVNANLAYGEVEYSRLQYEGVHARRKMALLNNGVMVVEDNIWTDDAYAGRKTAGTLYNVWTKVADKGLNWVITNPKTGHFPDGSNGGLMSTLLYFAPSGEFKQGLNSDIDFYVCAPLKKQITLKIVSAIIPMPYMRALSNGKVVGDGIKTVRDAAGNTVVRIPCGSEQTLKVSLFAGGSVPADYTIEGKEPSAGRDFSVQKLDAKVNTPYSVSFGRRDEFYVPGFKSDFELNENRFRSVRIGDRSLLRGIDYRVCGNVLGLTPAFAKTLTDARARTNLTVSFTAGKDVTLKLNGDTTSFVTLFNSRRSRNYTADEMALPYGFTGNSRVKAVNGDYEIAFFDDWLFRGNPTVLVVKNNQTVKLPSTGYKSFHVRRMN